MSLNQTINNPGLDMEGYMQSLYHQKNTFISVVCAGTKTFNMIEACFPQP